jgi:hypothetical protein
LAQSISTSVNHFLGSNQSFWIEKVFEGSVFVGLIIGEAGGVSSNKSKPISLSSLSLSSVFWGVKLPAQILPHSPINSLSLR